MSSNVPRRGRRGSYEEARSRFHAHPGRIEHVRIRAFITTFTDVFEPNWHDLRALLDDIATNPDAMISMLQSLGSSSATNGVETRLNRHLHNYIASASSLVEHSRVVLKGRPDAFIAEWKARLSIVSNDDAVSFITNLRNVSLHRSLPILAYTLKGTQSSVTSSEAELSVKDLLSSKSWNAAQRAYISSHGDRLPIRPIVKRHYALVSDLNVWLISRAQEDNRSAFNEANEIIVEAEADLRGESIRAARRRMDDVSSDDL